MLPVRDWPEHPCRHDDYVRVTSACEWQEHPRPHDDCVQCGQMAKASCPHDDSVRISGEAHAREARLVEIFRAPDLESRKLATFANMCTRFARPLRSYPAEVRGLPRPSLLMGFRGVSRPFEASTNSQNPFNFSLQDDAASGARAYNTTKGAPAMPRARTNPGCLSSFI